MTFEELRIIFYFSIYGDPVNLCLYFLRFSFLFPSTRKTYYILTYYNVTRLIVRIFFVIIIIYSINSLSKCNQQYSLGWDINNNINKEDTW